MRDNSGFTLIELIMVILLLGILSIYAAPKLDLSLFRQTGFFLQAMSSIRYAQKQAIASGCNVEVDIDASGCQISWSNPAPPNANCPTDADSIRNPASNNVDFCDGSTAATTPTNGEFRFDNIGRPLDTSNTVLTSPQDVVIADRTIRVEAETGYTHEN